MNVSTTPYQNARLLIDGEWVESQTTEWHDIVNPATQQVLAKVPFATPDEVNAAIAAAQRAFQTWKLTPIGARMRIMLKLQALIREHSKRSPPSSVLNKAKPLPTPRAIFSVAWKWSNTRAPSAPYKWANSQKTWQAALIPTPCANLSACVRALPLSTSRL